MKKILIYSLGAVFGMNFVVLLNIIVNNDNGDTNRTIKIILSTVFMCLSLFIIITNIINDDINNK